MIGHSIGNNLVDGSNNTFIGHGVCSSGPDSSASFNVVIGDESGFQLQSDYNTIIGAYAGRFFTGATGSNTFVGFNAGEDINTGYNNTIVGCYKGTSAMTNNVVLSDGDGVRRLQFNSSGAMGISTGAAGIYYGSTGQYLTSQGSNAPPIWYTPVASSFSTSNNSLTTTSPTTVLTTDATTTLSINATASTLRNNGNGQITQIYVLNNGSGGAFTTTTDVVNNTLTTSFTGTNDGTNLNIVATNVSADQTYVNLSYSLTSFT